MLCAGLRISLRRGQKMTWARHRARGLEGLALLVGAAILLLARPAAAAARNLPTGFWYATDSATVVAGGSGPYTEPVIGGAYGGYVGMLGDWAEWQGCRSYKLAWSDADSRDANVNHVDHTDGIGTAAYWFMGGPGVDPRYDGTVAEAYAWGERQAQRFRSDLKTKGIYYPILFMDIERPESTVFDPALDNGWDHVYTSACSGQVKASYIAPSVDRAVVNGFAAWITQHTDYKVGIYASPADWTAIFGTGTASSLPDTYEWTSSQATGSLASPPSGWCLLNDSACANFFGGTTGASQYAVMWQWSQVTGNGVGDFDVVDANRNGLRGPGPLKNAGTGFCLTSQGRRRRGAPVEMWRCDGTANQRWYVPRGTSALRNKGDGMCVNDPGGKLRNRVELDLYPCLYGGHEVFTFGRTTSRGGNMWFGPSASRYCLSSLGRRRNAAVADLWGCDLHENQYWTGLW